MQSFHPKSTFEQLAGHLREQIRRKDLSGEMPGVKQLVETLGVGTETVIAAMDTLEKEGLLVTQGPRRRRKILEPEIRDTMTALRVAILHYDPGSTRKSYLIDIQHQLIEAGHTIVAAPKTLKELGMDPQRIARIVQKVDADAWVVVAGSSEVLAWFASQPFPAFALFGRLINVPLASTSPKKAPAYTEMVAHLVSLGHRRIVLLAQEERRKPKAGFLEQHFLDQLEAHNVKTGPYNLPDWEDSPEGLERVLDSLFQHTLPTALFIDGIPLFHAVRTHLANKGILAPQHVSLISCDDHTTFEWSRPTISCIRWEERPIVRRVVQWAHQVALGKDDRRKTSTIAKFIVGGTIGPAIDRAPIIKKEGE